MTQTRVSISIDADNAAAIREAAERSGMTVSAYIEAATMDAVERDARVRALFAEWDAADAKDIAAAMAMTQAQLWADAEPLPEQEAAELRAQLARIAAQGKQRRSA